MAAGDICAPELDGVRVSRSCVHLGKVLLAGLPEFVGPYAGRRFEAAEREREVARVQGGGAVATEWARMQDGTVVPPRARRRAGEVQRSNARRVMARRAEGDRTPDHTQAPARTSGGRPTARVK